MGTAPFFKPHIHMIVLPDLIDKRNPDTCKNDYGHALLIAGSRGKMGAALLNAKACLRSGAGLLTVHSPTCGLDIMQTALPEAMVIENIGNSHIGAITHDLSRYQAIAMGPGIGTDKETCKALTTVMDTCRETGIPLVLDADALNIIATNGLHRQMPPGTVITPHAREYERLFRNSSPEEMAREHHIVIVKKSHQTHVYAPDGAQWINRNGNAGMATAGSGDVLTGIILALEAQGLDPYNAACTGVYMHGMAGDKAAATQNQASIIASDIIDGLKTIHKR